MNNPVVVLGTARTPLGGLQGDLSGLAAPQLGAAAIAASVERSALGGRAVDEVVFGCVLSAGQGRSAARQAAIAAGLGVTRACDDGQQNVWLGHDRRDDGARRPTSAGPMKSSSPAAWSRCRMRLAPAAEGALRSWDWAMGR